MKHATAKYIADKKAEILARIPAEPIITGSVDLSSFGSIGSADDSAILQAALDATDGLGVVITAPKGSQINIRGTVYMGNNILDFTGSKVNCILDSGYTQKGNAARKAEGCILSKATTGAGYGLSSIEVLIKGTLNISLVRSDDSLTVKTGLLLENVKLFRVGALHLTSSTSGTSEVTPLDFYQGVSGVHIDSLICEFDSPYAPGGIWIRNLSTSIATENFIIERMALSGKAQDEFLAIYNFSNATSVVRNIWIGSLVINSHKGGRGQGLSVFNSFSYTPDNISGIVIESLWVSIADIEASQTTTRAINFRKCAPQIGRAGILWRAGWNENVLQFAFVIRSQIDTGQTEYPNIGDCRISIEKNNKAPLGAGLICEGRINFERLIIQGAHQSGFSGGLVRSGVVDKGLIVGGYYSKAVLEAESLTGFVIGPIENVDFFKGSHVIDDRAFGKVFAGFLANNPTAASISYDALVRHIPSGAVGSRVVGLLTDTEKSAHISYKVIGPKTGTLDTDFVSPLVELTTWEGIKSTDDRYVILFNSQKKGFEDMQKWDLRRLTG